MQPLRRSYEASPVNSGSPNETALVSSNTYMYTVQFHVYFRGRETLVIFLTFLMAHVVLGEPQRIDARREIFSMKMASFVEAGDHTGYFFVVKRQMDQKEKYVICSKVFLHLFYRKCY